MEKTYKKLDELKEWDKNPRSISPQGFDRLKKQLTKLGEYKPLIVTKDGTVLGGNMRLKAMRELGWQEVWVNVVEAETEEEKIEYALSDNDRAGQYEGDQLADLVGNFPDVDYGDFAVDIKPPIILKDLIDQYREVEEDEIPAIAEGEPDSKLGEIYTLGRHRLLCGDATKIEDVEKLMDGKQADMLLIDPPYGVDYSSKNEFLNAYDKGNHIQKDIEGDIENKEDTVQLWRDALTNVKIQLKNGADFYINFSGDKLILLLLLLLREKEIDLPEKQILIWVKNNHVLGRSNYNYKHEFILYGWNGSGHKFYGGFDTTVWEINKPMKNDLHPTMKPINLLARAINHGTEKDMLVLDVFGGSGSTLIACEQTNRTCYMMEIDPKYCDVIRKRYQNYIDKEKNKV